MRCDIAGNFRVDLQSATSLRTLVIVRPPENNTIAMLDTFEILSTSGVVLWSRTYVPVGANVINSLIRDVFIEERISPGANAVDTSASHKPTYKKEGYTLKWTTAKDLGLIFVVRRNWNFIYVA